jgi:hypothetical protein
MRYVILLCSLFVSLTLIHFPDVVGIVKEVGPVGEITSKATNKTVDTLSVLSSYRIR